MGWGRIERARSCGRPPPRWPLRGLAGPPNGPREGPASAPRSPEKVREAKMTSKLVQGILLWL
eukprot:9213228-Pyramimonas_sp.AAC.1